MKRRGRPLAALALACAAAGTAGCDSSSGRAEPVASASPVRAFAPLVRLAAREEAYPLSALTFIANSGLEWAGGPCGYERDITPSAELPPGEPSPLPPLEAERLGREPTAYRVRPSYRDCDRPRPQVFTTAQRTRPFDGADRPVGLHPDEGFNLDVELGPARGRRRLGPDGRLTGAPAYYAVEREPAIGRRGVRIGYWFLFGVEQRPGVGGTREREGDWERVDVLARRHPGSRRYVPRRLELRADGEVHAVDWDDIEVAAGQHPVVYLERGLHTPRADGDCGRCTEWATWRRLRSLRAEPWWGYGGGWGEIGRRDRDSGPAGPSPFEVGGASFGGG